MTVPSGAPAEIRLIDLEKRFGVVRAVDGVSLDVRPGEFFSLLGPSGCGKTTTLRMIGGFELPTAGRILLRDRDITHEPPDQRPVNMVFQQYALFPHLDVAGNVGVRAARARSTTARSTRGSPRRSTLVRLEGYERRRPSELSGGQQQRVALARALVNRPNVLLLDEPLGALDLKLRRQLQIELKRIQSEVGITFVYVTHDQEEALTMSDRIAVMHAGRGRAARHARGALRAAGDPVRGRLHRHDQPADGRSSRSMACALIRLGGGDACRVAADDLRAGPVGRALDPTRIDRPQAIERLDAAGRHRAAEVEQVAYLGGTVQYQVRTDGGLRHRPGAEDRRTLPVGSDVDIAWPPAEALVLGAGARSLEEELAMTTDTTGRRIDLEKELVRYMVEQRISPSRPARAHRARRGCRGAGTGHRRVHARAARRDAPRPRRPRRRRRSPPSAAAPTVSRSPTPVPARRAS